MTKTVEPAAAGYSQSAARVLDVAERLVQQRGFNGFSYADIAAELGVTKPALHYHFASKAELGSALVTRYTTRFAAGLDRLADRDPRERLAGYAGLYREVLVQDRMCLCGMLAAEFRTLPEAMRQQVRQFLALNEEWLQQVLIDGRADGTLQCHGTPLATARLILDSLEGAMLITRTHDDLSRFDHAVERLLAAMVSD